MIPPSMSDTLRSTTGKPASTPEPARFGILLDAGDNSFGTEPPTTLSNTKPVPGSVFGEDLDRANWPEPPICFLWV